MVLPRLPIAFLVFFAFASCAKAQTNYSWAAYPTRCTGVGVYTQTNMTVDVTGTGFANYGPQSAASACASTSGQRYFSPKYVTSPNGSAPDWQQNGLALGVDWPNTTSNATVLITFTTPVCGPLTFTIYDINSGTWGGFNPVWRDRVTISGTNSGGTTIYPSTISGCANNTVGGANNNIISAGLNTGCTNGTHTITFNSPTIKTLTILYNSLAIDATYGTDPDPEYIIISDITSTPCALPLEAVQFAVSCENDQPLLSWQTEESQSVDYFEVLQARGENDFVPVQKLIPDPGAQSLSWRDEDMLNAPLYKLRAVHRDGSIQETPAVSAQDGCGDRQLLKVFPNPSQGELWVWFRQASPGPVQLSLVDAAGKELPLALPTEWSGESRVNVARLNLRDLPEGVYLLKVNSAEGFTMQRLVLLH